MAAEWLAQYGVLVDRNADVPVGVQLAWGLRSAVASGALQPGERLPPLRELAEGLGLNTNTVRAVIAELERQGFLDARQGSGTFVAATPPVQRTLPALVDEMVLAAHAAGVEPRLLATALFNAQPRPPAGGEVAARRRVRQDIATLERLLVDVVREPPSPLESGRRAGWAAGGAALPTLAQLEAQRDALLHRLAVAWGAQEADPPSGEPAVAEAEPRRAAKRAPRPSPRPRIQPA